MPTLSGFAFDSAGVALSSGITVNIYARNTTTPVVTTTSTNASGYWTRPGIAEGRYDVEIVNGTTIRRMMYDDEIQIERGEFKNLQIRGSDNAFALTFVLGAIAAARNLTIPTLTGNDTMAVLGMAQTFTANKTFNSTNLLVRNPADTFSYTLAGGAITADRQLNLPVITGTDTMAVLGLSQTFSGATVTFSGGTASTSVSTGTIVISGTGGLGVGGNLNVGGVLNAFGGNTNSSVAHHFTGTKTGYAGIAFDVFTLSPAANTDAAVLFFQPATGNTINKAGSGTHPVFAGAYFVAPAVGAGAGALTDAATVYISGAMAGGTNNYALLVGGLARFNANVVLGGNAARSGTAGTNRFDIFDGTAPVGTLANGISLYSTAGELRVMDSAGNATLLSPHARDGSWIYDSVSPVTGKHLRIDMERMVKWLNRRFGQNWVHEVVV